nr:hypothetical protein CFP56_07765 [Quercus suber]
MSSDSLALFRKSLGPDLSALAEQHLQHDLNEQDRTALYAAARTVSVHVTLGSALGVTLGLLLAARLRAHRAALFRTFRAREQPTAVRFASGREEPLPDLAALARPRRLGDVATAALLGAGGLFFGGETGVLTGSFRARQAIARDRASRDRIQAAFRRFQADALRRQADLLERGREGSYGL